MSFIGAVPKEVVSQMLATVPFDQWGSVHVGCSGSFRIDRAVKMRHPAVRVYGNDVSLLTCCLGALAMRREFDFRFKGELEFVEAHLAGCDFKTRVAAVEVAVAMSQYGGKNEFAIKHRAHYRNRFAEFTADTIPKLDAFIEEVQLEDFFAGDFRDQITRAEEAGGGFVCFAPTYKGGYERMYRFLHENVEWTPPPYNVWNPKDVPVLLNELDGRGLPYCVVTDQLLDGREPNTEYRGSNKPVYTYSRGRGASILKRAPRAKPFRYTPIDAEKIGPGSRVDVRMSDSACLAFLKNVYLAKGIRHVAGNYNYLVYVDDMLVGGFTYALTKFGDPVTELYLLSDFAISRERRLSKLVAMLTLSRDVIAPINRKMIADFRRITTTAFTANAVSMKYRGIYEVSKRAEEHIQYEGTVTDRSLQETFDEWLEKFGGTGTTGGAGSARKSRNAGNKNRAAQAGGAEAAGGERSVHAA
jgi:hypothetical protein